MTRVVNPELLQSGMPGANGLLIPPNHLSFSQLTKLSPRYARSCPRNWAYAKLLGLPYPAGNGMTLGKALDRAVTSFFQRRLLGDNPAVALTGAEPEISRAILTADTWVDQAKPRGDYVEMMETAFRVFADTYATTLPASLQRDHVYEVSTASGGRRRMVGYSDWIDPDGTITDLKYTGSPKWNRDGDWYPDYVAQIRDQLCTYWMGRVYAERNGVLDATAPVIPRGRLVVVCAAINRKTPEIRELIVTFDDALLQEVADAVRDADVIASADSHPARPGPACQWCPYTERCQIDSARTAPLTQELAA